MTLVDFVPRTVPNLPPRDQSGTVIELNARCLARFNPVTEAKCKPFVHNKYGTDSAWAKLARLAPLNLPQGKEQNAKNSKTHTHTFWYATAVQ